MGCKYCTGNEFWENMYGSNDDCEVIPTYYGVTGMLVPRNKWLGGDCTQNHGIGC
jgi:hypothetical protein